MVISQTPYRVSLLGGGTDLPAFYQREYGAVLSMTLARHMYVTVHRRFQDNIRVAYSRTETADSVACIEHELVREAMRATNVDGPLEITTIGDVPSGTGLGSSSSLTVGLLHALCAYSSRFASREFLSEEACRIEMEVLGKPIGKQDQYAAAFGGVNYFRFNSDGRVDVQPVPVKSETLKELERHVLLMYTERQRSADQILQRQTAGTADRLAELTQMRDLAARARDCLLEHKGLEQLGKLLDEGWQLKRSLGFGISDAATDRWYGRAREAGAWGGKVLGAGGGGFLLLLAPPGRHAAIREALGRPRELPFQIDPSGSRIIFVNDHN